jgi:hypothetical protein
MSIENTNWKESLIHLLALASRLEGEGQYNIAKLLRAGADSLGRREACSRIIPTDRDALAAGIEQAVEALSGLNVDQNLLTALERGAAALSEGRLPLFDETPNAYVCRTCGHLALGEPDQKCPTCGAWPGTYKKFLPIYWLDALEPFTALDRLRRTPIEVAELLKDLPDDVLNRQPEDDGWAVRNTLSHLRDAQGVLDFRIDLFLKEQHPVLESKAVFEWATQEEERPPSGLEIFESYRSSRHETIKKLENLPLADWWLTGTHEEFGPVTLRQQVSYFASHEITHLPQIERLRRRFSESI